MRKRVPHWAEQNWVLCCVQGGWLPLPVDEYASVLLVHNAGTCGDLVYSWQQTLGNIQREMQLNVVGPAAMTSALLGALVRCVRSRRERVLCCGGARPPHAP